MQVRHLGLMRYSEALERMEALHAAMVAQPELEESLLIVEHPPVVTMGLRERSQDLMTSENSLQLSGIDFCRIDRGGSVTVHEPGQLVLYPLVRVDARLLTVRKLVWALEEIMIAECGRWGITAARDDINAGVWVGSEKIGAVGVRVSSHVSKHGLALNVRNSLSTFSHIVPCGLHGRGVTSLTRSGAGGLNENLPLIGERMAADFIRLIGNFRAPAAEAGVGVGVAAESNRTHTDASPL